MRVNDQIEFRVWDGSKLEVFVDGKAVLSAVAPPGHEIHGLAGFQGLQKSLSPEEIAERSSPDWSPGGTTDD